MLTKLLRNFEEEFFKKIYFDENKKNINTNPKHSNTNLSATIPNNNINMNLIQVNNLYTTIEDFSNVEENLSTLKINKLKDQTENTNYLKNLNFKNSTNELINFNNEDLNLINNLPDENMNQNNNKNNNIENIFNTSTNEITNSNLPLNRINNLIISRDSIDNRRKDFLNNNSLNNFSKNFSNINPQSSIEIHEHNSNVIDINLTNLNKNTTKTNNINQNSNNENINNNINENIENQYKYSMSSVNSSILNYNKNINENSNFNSTINIIEPLPNNPNTKPTNFNNINYLNNMIGFDDLNNKNILNKLKNYVILSENRTSRQFFSNNRKMNLHFHKDIILNQENNLSEKFESLMYIKFCYNSNKYNKNEILTLIKEILDGLDIDNHDNSYIISDLCNYVLSNGIIELIPYLEIMLQKIHIENKENIFLVKNLQNEISNIIFIMKKTEKSLEEFRKKFFVNSSKQIKNIQIKPNLGEKFSNNELNTYGEFVNINNDHNITNYSFCSQPQNESLSNIKDSINNNIPNLNFFNSNLNYNSNNFMGDSMKVEKLNKSPFNLATINIETNIFGDDNININKINKNSKEKNLDLENIKSEINFKNNTNKLYENYDNDNRSEFLVNIETIRKKFFFEEGKIKDQLNEDENQEKDLTNYNLASPELSHNLNLNNFSIHKKIDFSHTNKNKNNYISKISNLNNSSIKNQKYENINQLFSTQNKKNSSNTSNLKNTNSLYNFNINKTQKYLFNNNSHTIRSEYNKPNIFNNKIKLIKDTKTKTSLNQVNINLNSDKSLKKFDNSEKIQKSKNNFMFTKEEKTSFVELIKSEINNSNFSNLKYKTKEILNYINKPLNNINLDYYSVKDFNVNEQIQENLNENNTNNINKNLISLESDTERNKKYLVDSPENHKKKISILNEFISHNKSRESDNIVNESQIHENEIYKNNLDNIINISQNENNTFNISDKSFVNSENVNNLSNYKYKNVHNIPVIKNANDYFNNKIKTVKSKTINNVVDNLSSNKNKRILTLKNSDYSKIINDSHKLSNFNYNSDNYINQEFFKNSEFINKENILGNFNSEEINLNKNFSDKLLENFFILDKVKEKSQTILKVQIKNKIVKLSSRKNSVDCKKKINYANNIPNNLKEKPKKITKIEKKYHSNNESVNIYSRLDNDNENCNLVDSQRSILKNDYYLQAKNIHLPVKSKNEALFKGHNVYQNEYFTAMAPKVINSSFFDFEI